MTPMGGLILKYEIGRNGLIKAILAIKIYRTLGKIQLFRTGAKKPSQSINITS